MTFEYNWKLILSSVLLALICRLDVIHGCSGGGETPGDGVTEAPGEYLSYVVLKRGIKKTIFHSTKIIFTGLNPLIFILNLVCDEGGGMIDGKYRFNVKFNYFLTKIF